MIYKPNLLPPEFRIIRPISWRRIISVILVLTLVCGAGFIYLLFIKDIKSLEDQKGSMEQALNQLSPTQERMKEILDKQSEIKRMKSLNGVAKADSKAMSEILGDVAGLMPFTVSFTSVQYYESSLVIRGRAKDSLTVSDYVIALRQLDYFVDVEINIISRSERGVKFIITGHLPKKGGNGNV